MHVTALPYKKNALEPFLSEQTIDLHYEKHHKGYALQLSALISNRPEYEGCNLESIIKKSHKKEETSLFNNAAQVWNHNFYWHSLCPKDRSKAPSSGPLFDAVTKSFGDIKGLAQKLIETAMNQFGSGWVWLVKSAEGNLFFEKTSNAFVPWVASPANTPLFVCDVWEHAYYVDYHNRRKDYAERFVNFINWDFVDQNFHSKKTL